MNLKKVFIVSAKAPVNGSVTAEVKDTGGRLTVLINGLEKGKYSVFIGDEKIGQADVGLKGRLIKHIDITADKAEGHFYIADENGREVCCAETDMGGTVREKAYIYKEVKDETEEVNEKTMAAEQYPVTREYPEAEPQRLFTPKEEPQAAEYGFSSDLGTIIKRFKEQMERLEKSEVLTAKETEAIENSGKTEGKGFTPFNDGDEGWEKVCRDYIWRLPVRDIHFPSNPFFTCSQKKYKHILFKEMGDRYRVGAADIYNGKNTAKAAACGFYGFAAESGKMPKEGDRGYWMADILKSD